MIVTAHAFIRYQERIANVDIHSITQALDTPAVRTAIAFGAPYVRLGSGHRIVLEGDRIVTILPPETQTWRLGTPHA